MCVTLVHFGLFFPGEGGMILPKDFKYDPQWIKPLEGAKGSDDLDFSKMGASTTTATDKKPEAAASSV